jgi:Tfp pilus assembly PilM family ATPase
VNLQRWLTPVPPTVAIEIASRRVTVVEVPLRASGASGVTAYAGEGLPEGAVTPTLSGTNVARPDVVAAAVRRSIERAGLEGTRRAALVVPDSVARVSMLAFDDVPSRPQELDELVRWQVRKGTPFPLEAAIVSHVPAATFDDKKHIAAVVARRDVITEYEQVLSDVGIHAGTVDIASFNVINAVLAAASDDGRDWLVVHIAPEATSLAIVGGGSLKFYRHRAHADDEPLGSLVHQTAMYHEDRLGGGGFGRVWLAGTGSRADGARREIAARLNMPVENVDVRPAVSIVSSADAAPELLDALAAPVGILVREARGSAG